MKVSSGIVRFDAAGEEVSAGACDIYSLKGVPVAVVLWEKDSPRPSVCVQDAETGLCKFALVSGDDVPHFDQRDGRACKQAELHYEEDGRLKGVSIVIDENSQIVLLNSRANERELIYGLYPESRDVYFVALYNETGVPDFKETGISIDRIAAVFGSEASAYIQADRGQNMGPDYPANYRRTQYVGLTLDERLEAGRNVVQNDKKLPVCTVAISDNTFEFFVDDKPLGATDLTYKAVTVRQHTDFTGTILERDFPSGDVSIWEGSGGMVKSNVEAVNIVGTKLIENWDSREKKWADGVIPTPPYELRTFEGFGKGDQSVPFNSLDAAVLAFRAESVEKIPRVLASGETLIELDPDGGLAVLFWDSAAEAIYLAAEEAEATKVSSAADQDGQEEGLTEEQRQALLAFRENNGRFWKTRLTECWMLSDYPNVPKEHTALLQQVRNRLGPVWLTDLKSEELVRPVRPEVSVEQVGNDPQP